MNKIFKVIWNYATQTWVAVSELQSAKGKTKSCSTATVVTTAIIAVGGLGATLGANAAKVTGTLGQEITSKDKFGREITSTSSNAKDYSPVYGKVLNSSMFDVAVNDIAIGSNVTAMGKIGFYRAGQDEPTDGKGRIGSAIGIGSNIITYGSPSVTIGYTLVNESPQTVLIGSNSTLAAGSNHTMMVGLVNSVATKSNHSSLYGNFNKLGEESSNSVLAGANNTVGNKSSSATVVGSFNTLGNQSSITAAIGTRNTIKDNTNNTVVLAGFSTIGADGVNTDRSILVGFQSNVSKNNAIGIGSYTNATENNAIAIGNSSTSSKSSAIAIGNSSTSSGLFAVAIGSNSNSSNAATIALGASANASGDRSVAIGVSANATGSYSNAFGRTAVVNGENSTTIGTESTVSGNKSVGIGYKNSVTGHNTVVLGNNVTATTSGSVILGESASTTGSHNVVTESSATINGISYSGFRGTVADVGRFVSVGKVGDERKIINVAAGNISATSTDAINGSQLYLLTANSGWKLDIGAINGGTNSRNVTADGDHEFIKSNDLVKFIAGKNIDIAQNNGEITISAKDPVTTGGSYSFKVKGGDDQPSTVTNAKTVSFQSSSPNMLGVSLDHNGGNPNVLFELKTATNPIITRNSDGSGGQVSLTDASNKHGVVTASVLAKTINNSFWRGKVATKAGSTGESNTAENKQMEVSPGEEVILEAGNNINIQLDSDNNKYTISAKAPETASLTKSNNGNITAPTGNEGSKLVNATTVANAINNVSHKVATLNDNTQVQANENNANGKEVKAGDKINFIAGKNLLVKQGTSTAADGHNITFSLDKDITVNNITANNLTMGNVKINKDTGINAGDKKITNVSDGTIGENSKDAINGGQLYSELNAHKWKLTTDVDGGERAQTDDKKSVEEIGKGDTITVKAGKNVIIKQAGKNITISAKDAETTGLTVTNGNVSSPSQTDGNKLVNATTVANALNNVSWSLQEKGVEKDKVSAGNIVNFVDGTGTKINITTSNNNSTVKYDVDFGSITVNETDGKAPTITEGNKVASTANVVEAINKSGWKLVGNNTVSTEVNTVVNPGESVKFIDGNNTKAIIDVTDTSAPTVKINVETTALTENTTTKGKIDAPTVGGDKLVNATTVANAINKSGWNLDVGRVDDNALTQDEEKDEKSLVSPGEDVSLKAGKNLRIKKQGNDVIYATKDNVTFSTIQLGDNTGPNITHNNGDIKFSKPDGSAVKLTNVANGTDNNDAVNVSQLNAHKWKFTTGTEGSGTQAGTAMEESVGKDDLITFKAGDNVIIKQAGKNITISAKSAETTALTLTNGNVTSPSQTEGNKLVNATTVANALNNVSWGLASDGTKISDIKAGNTVDFADGTGTDAAVTSENGITVVKFNAKTDGKTINVGKDGNITAVTGNIINSADNSGKVAVPTDEGDKLVNQTTVVNAINNVSHKVATLNNNEQVGENQNNADGVATKAGDKLNFIAGKNLLVKQQGHNITFSLDKDITVNNVSANNLTIGPVKVTNNGIDAGGKTITNVTAGVNGTDAVNVSQLNNATGNLTNKGLNFAGDNGDVSHRNLGETLTIKGGATGTLTNNNIGVTSDGKGTLKVELAKDINLTPNGSLKVGDVTINENGINAGGDKITNVADGNVDANSKDAVNGSQLYQVQQVANAGWNLSVNNGDKKDKVAPGASVDLNNKDGNIKITKDGNNVTFDLANVVNIGNTNTIKIDGDKGTIGGLTNKTFDPKNITPGQAASEDQLKSVYDNLSTSITNSGFDLAGKKVEGTNGQFDDKRANDKRINNNDKFTLDAGKNIKISQVDNGYEIATTDNLDAKELVIRGKDGKDGVTVTAKDGYGAIGINGKDGANGSFTFIQGDAGVDGKDGETKTRIEYTPVGPDGKPGTPEQVATLEDGMKFVGNDGNVVTKKLNETLDIVGGIKDTDANPVSDKNTYVSNKDRKLVVQISENPEFNSVKTGDTTINNNGLTINNGPSITKTGVDAAGNKVTNVKDGDVSANSKDAVNGSQLHQVKETAEAGWNLTANGKDKSNVKPRATVDLNNKDGNVEITKSGNNVTFGLAKDIKLGDNGSVNVGGVTINKGGINAGGKTISGVADGKLGHDAVNMNQLNGVVNNVNQKLGDMNHRVNKLDKRVRGIGANAAAAASLPQVYIPGKSMIAASTGGYNGASAIAVGYSRASDNGKVILKITGTANSAGHYSGGVGLGYQW